jgi:hypothetical protein
MCYSHNNHGWIPVFNVICSLLFCWRLRRAYTNCPPPLRLLSRCNSDPTHPLLPALSTDVKYGSKKKGPYGERKTFTVCLAITIQSVYYNNTHMRPLAVYRRFLFSFSSSPSVCIVEIYLLSRKSIA